MRYKKLGNTDLNVSVVALGTWALAGSVAGSDSWGLWMKKYRKIRFGMP